MLEQRKVDILRSDAQIKRDEMLEKFQIAFLGGRYGINDNNSEYEPAEFGAEEQMEPEPITPDEQQRELPTAGSGNSNTQPI